jgi:GSH-dependent disulfide-bond oxidoreductase
MIQIFGEQTPNVFKPLIALEEFGVPYRRVPVDIAKGEQFEPAFLAISPNNRVPAMVDDEPEDGGEPLSLFESGAILLYLADKYRSLIPSNARQRAEVVAWIMWQVGGQGPMAGQAGHFRNYAPEAIPYAIDRYSSEIQRLYRVLNTRLEEREFVVGDYSIADIACWPWVFFRAHHGISISDYPNVERWYRAIEARPAVMRMLDGWVPPEPPKYTAEERAVLFGMKQTT